MNKTIKTLGIIGAIASMACIGCLYGTVQKIQLEDFIDTKSEEFYKNYVDMRTITRYSPINDDLLLYTDDNFSYYVDAKNMQQDAQNVMAEVYYINCDSDYDELFSRLECRNGKIIIEISSGTVTSENGDGIDIGGYYRHYDMSKFSIGDKVQSVFVYQPNNNCIDDVLYRVDTLIE